MKIDFVNEFASAVINIQLGTFIWRRHFVGREHSPILGKQTFPLFSHET